MTPLETLGFALGTSFASGLNVYATAATLGMMHRLEYIRLPSGLEGLAHPVVVGLALVMFTVEFFADKIPYFDSAWDLIHTFIRPPAAALAAFGAFDAAPEAWRFSAAVLAGGVALTAHGAKATTRAAANTSPEPVSNWLLSFTEDGVALGLAWLAVTHPYVTLVVVVVLLALAAWLLVKLAGFLRRALGKALRRAQGAAAHSA